LENQVIQLQISFLVEKVLDDYVEEPFLSGEEFDDDNVGDDIDDVVRGLPI
jgi:hypothetical protein